MSIDKTQQKYTSDLADKPVQGAHARRIQQSKISQTSILLVLVFISVKKKMML